MPDLEIEDRSAPVCGAAHPTFPAIRCARSAHPEGDHGSLGGLRWPQDATREAVYRALDNARANGYPPNSAQGADDARAIAADLGTYDPALEGRAVDDLAPHVEAWLVIGGER